MTADRLGPYREGFASYRRMLATVPPGSRLLVFQNACAEVAKYYVAKGLDRAVAADELADMALTAGFDDVDAVQWMIAQGFAKIERPDEVPDLDDDLDRRSPPISNKANGGGADHTKPRFKLTAFYDIKFSTTPNYLVKGMIPRDGLVVVWGPPKCGKSFFCFDLAMHIALGREYHGHHVQQGTVVYLALEGGGGFAGRVEAWRRRHLDGHRGPVPFYLVGVPMDIIAEYAVLIETIRAQCATAPSAVFIDTLNRGLNGSENKPEDMAKFIRAADLIRAAFGCTVVVVHHCGVESSRPRGQTSLTGADDAQIAVARDHDGVIKVTTEHMKDAEPGAPMGFRLERIELGQDDDGDAISSCVIVPAAISSGTSAKVKLTANQRRFLDILTDATLDAPQEHRTATNIPGGRIAITREWLRMACSSKGWFDPKAADNRRRAKLSDMLNALAGKRLIGVSDRYVWDARTPEQSATVVPFPQKPVGVAFMVTKAMKDRLRERGLSDDDIHNLTPWDANDLLSQDDD